MAVMRTNTSSVYFTNATNSKNGIKRERLSFTNVDASLIVFSMVTIVAHLVTDTVLVASYYISGHKFWALSTVALAFIPAIIIQAFSIRWHMLDNAASLSKWISHCCLFGVFFRHVDAFQTGLEARQSGDIADFQSLFHLQSDISMLQLFESFMKSAPQLVLQVYIMIQVCDWGHWTGLSAGASLISLAWAMATYTHAMRQARPDKQKATIAGLALQATWRTGLLVARISALVLFAICCQAWIFLLLGIHWLGMTVWVVLQKTDLCSTPWEECAYNAVVGVVYCFCFFNLREGRARGRMLAFYVVTVTQNLACLYLFLALAQHTHPVLASVAAAAIVGGTIIGLCAMLTYYRFFHPSGTITLFGPPNSSSSALSPSVQNNQRTSMQTISSDNTQVAVERSVLSQVQLAYSSSSQMPNDIEKANSLRSLKHLRSVDRDGSLSSQSDDIPVNGCSPQPDEGCTDKRLLLSSRASTHRQPSPDSIQIPSVAFMEQLKTSNLTVLALQNNGLSQSSICNQSTGSNFTSHTTLNSQSHPSPTPNSQGWSSQTLNAALSNQSVHSSNTSHSTVSGHSIQSNNSLVVNRPSQALRPVIIEKSVLQSIDGDVNDSKISWNCTSMMEDTQPSEIIESVAAGTEVAVICGMNKRRGICSSIELGLDKLEENDKVGTLAVPPDSTDAKLPEMKDSFARLCHKLVANAEVKQLGSFKCAKKEFVKSVQEKEEKEEKRESDYIDSKQSAISSDGTASEVLSAHDYENICAVNIARESWGLRSWRGYSDIETWLHDDSVVRDRRRDTLASIGTTTTMTSASSERSTASESPPPVRQQWESGNGTSAPPLPCRRPRQSYSRMDDYLDTLAYDLAEIEQREGATAGIDNAQDHVYIAQPYVVDQHGMLYPLPTSLDTILEELEESSVSASIVTAAESNSSAPAWASSLVATIDEIRMCTSNTLDDSGTVSELDFEVGSYWSLQLDSSVMAGFPSQDSPGGSPRGSPKQHFSSSLPSLLQAPRSWSHLTPEEVLFLSELKPQPEGDFSSEYKCGAYNLSSDQINSRKTGKRPRRKFSLLREKFEPKYEPRDVDCYHNDQNNKSNPGRSAVKREFNEKRIEYLDKKEPIGTTISLPVSNSSSKLSHLTNNKNGIIDIKRESAAAVSPFKEVDLKGSEWASTNRAISMKNQALLQQVIAQPTLVPHTKKLSLASNASA